ncbi:MAG TPA: hypothetical protein VIJ82_17045 [Streptosporangiaceae bacterium]
MSWAWRSQSMQNWVALGSRGFQRAADLPDDVLDRIDEIVPPGTTINPADNGRVSPASQPAGRRR